MQFTTKSNEAGKLPVIVAARKVLIEQVAPLIMENLVDLPHGNGDNLTTRMDGIFIDVTGDDGKPAGRLQLNWSANYWAPRDKTAKKSDVDAPEVFTLSQHDVATLDSAIATFKENGDVENAVKLATIKSVYQREGKVSRDDLYIVIGLGTA